MWYTLGGMNKYLVSVQKLIPARAEHLFEIVADPAKHTLIDGSGTVQKSLSGNPKRLELGATFGMGMKMGKRYKMDNTVVEFEEGRRITWKPHGNYVWRYSFEPQGEQTLVTEEWDARTARGRRIMGLLGFPRRNRRGMRATLERLAQVVTEQNSQADE